MAHGEHRACGGARGPRRFDRDRGNRNTHVVDLVGATTTITVPPKTKALILARFSGQSVCYSSGGVSRGVCSVRILIGGVEADPAGGLSFAFDSTNNGAETPYSPESHSMDRSRGLLGPGTYTVQVQGAISDIGVILRLADWSLTVERVKI